MGTYSIVSVGAEKYQANKYYLEDNNGFIQATGAFDAEKVYYKLNDDGTYSTIKLVETDDLVWAPAKFYVLSDKTDENSQILDPNNEFNALLDYYQLTINEEASGAKRLDAPVTYGSQTYNYDTKEYRNAKFVNDLDKHFNIDYLATYFVMTEVFECYDSRGKNAMFAS